MPKRPLHLHEEVLLLALRKSGELRSGVLPQPALAGAVLSELRTLGRIEVTTRKGQEVVEPANDRPVGDPLLDATLKQIRTAKARYPIVYWAAVIAARWDLIPKTAESLARRGTVRCDRKSVLWVFTRKIYPQVDPRSAAMLRERIQRVIFDGRTPVDTRTANLVAIADRTGLLSANFDRKRLAAARSRIEGIVNGRFARGTTRGAIEAHQSPMLFIGAIMPMMMSSDP